MNPLLSSLLNEAHRRDLLAEAEAARMSAVLEQSPPPWRQKVMRYAGHLLLVAGTQLRLIVGRKVGHQDASLGTCGCP